MKDKAHLGPCTADLADLTVVKLRLLWGAFRLQLLAGKGWLLVITAAGVGVACATPWRAPHGLWLLCKRWGLLLGLLQQWWLLHERLLRGLVI